MLSIFFELFKDNTSFVSLFFVFLLFFPFISSFVLGFRSFYRFKYDTPVFFSLLLIWLSFEGSFVLLDYFVNMGISSIQISGPFWFFSDSVIVQWSLTIDYVTLIMFMVVTLVSWLVHCYSAGYMEGDPKFQLFFSYLSLFTFFMLILVSANNLIQLFIGWEGVGLCSFLLISFWNTRISANKAALKAMVVNKFGDYFLLFGIALLVSVFGSVSFSDFILYSSNSNLVLFFSNALFFEYFIFGYSFNLISVIAFFFFLGVMAKSAQFGLHTWLPDAMEGPTPVSALIHAATMVTAGVFLMVRFSNFFFFAEEVKPFIIFIGTLTTFFAATVALVQNDIKKVIAYSTCSQLGYMVTACGFDLYGFAFFHLAMHAFFKALLFLCAGSVIHALSDEQDIRKMGGLAYKLPVTFFCMLIASLSLAGFPFLSGFYSKESILETIWSIGNGNALFAYFFGICSVFFTSFYSFRLLFLVFFGKPNGTSYAYKNIHATSLFILFPLLVLSFLSIFLGYLSFDFFVNLKLNINFVSFVSFDFFIKILPLLLLVLSFFFSYFLYMSSFKKSAFSVLQYSSFFSVYSFLNKKWYVDTFYNFFLSRFSYILSYSFNYKLLEKGWIEYFGPTGIASGLTSGSFFLNKFQTGYFHDYLFYSISFIIFIFFLF